MKILHRYNESILWEGEAETIEEALSLALRSEANLREANLCEANLRGADLRGADLCEANLREANLCEADLRGANLREANLCEADLCEANLREANLCEADLCRADLRGADLCEANLREANLCEADLRGADLCRADLCRADLREANLCEANLRGAIFNFVPKINDIHHSIYTAISQPGHSLEMGDWHTCETTHCRAGWVTTLCGEAGKVLESWIGTAPAAALIYQASDPTLEKVPDFYASNEDAMEDIKRLAGVVE